MNDPADRPSSPLAGNTRAPADVQADAHDAARATAAGRPDDASRPPAAGGGMNTAVGVAGGVAAGTMAGLQAGALAGAVTLGVGAVAGAALGAAAGAALAQEADPGHFSAESDAHYRALYDGAPVADRGYDAVRPAYVFGHVAAAEPALAGLTFEQAEPALRDAWTDELGARAGGWAQAQRYVRDAFGHARADGAGARRDLRVVGSGGSAVDPIELDRARQGLPSTPDPAGS